MAEEEGRDAQAAEQQEGERPPKHKGKVSMMNAISAAAVCRAWALSPPPPSRPPLR